jgi:formate dehydrogenase subunit gamma
MTHPRGTLTRNTTAARINHWITGGCFVLLMLSGLSMFHPMLFFLSELFGGGQWARAMHPWIGTVLLVSYAGLIVQFWRDNLWSWDDVMWMLAINRVLANEEQRIAVLIHSMGAIAAIIIWIIHVYAAIWVRGSVRAMTQGYVTPGWAWRHHRKWLRRLAATGSSGPKPRAGGNNTPRI